MTDTKRLKAMLMRLFSLKRWTGYTEFDVSAWSDALRGFAEKDIINAMKAAINDKEFFEISTLLKHLVKDNKAVANDEWLCIIDVVNGTAKWGDLPKDTIKALLTWSGSPLVALRQGNTYLLAAARKAFLENYERLSDKPQLEGDDSVVSGLLNLGG